MHIPEVLLGLDELVGLLSNRLNIVVTLQRLLFDKLCFEVLPVGFEGILGPELLLLLFLLVLLLRRIVAGGSILSCVVIVLANDVIDVLIGLS